MAQVTYELLARWNHQTGILQGIHCKNYDTMTGREGDAMPVAMALTQGFPLSDILTQVEIGAVLAMDEARVNLAIEQAAHAATKTELAALRATINPA